MYKGLITPQVVHIYSFFIVDKNNNKLLEVNEGLKKLSYFTKVLE